MKKFWFGLITGLLVGGLACYLYGQKMEEKANGLGYNKGLDEGTIKGVAQGKTEQKSYDSLMAIPKKPVAVVVKKVVKPRPKPEDPNDVNYSVEGNNIGERIIRPDTAKHK